MGLFTLTKSCPVCLKFIFRLISCLRTSLPDDTKPKELYLALCIQVSTAFLPSGVHEMTPEIHELGAIRSELQRHSPVTGIAKFLLVCIAFLYKATGLSNHPTLIHSMSIGLGILAYPVWRYHPALRRYRS